MKHLFLFLFASVGNLIAMAQGESNIWMSSDTPLGGTSWGMDFSTANPVGFNFVLTNPLLAGMNANNSICNAAGQVQFYTNGRQVFTSTGQLMPNGSNLMYPNPGTSYSMPPLIVPRPFSQRFYYIFTLKDGGLFYSLVDIALNGGQGDVVQNRKNISLNGFAGTAGIVVTSKMVAVKGCGSVWVVVRSKSVNQYRSYEIRDTGMVMTPVISECGLLPLVSYHGPAYPGVLKASPDGRKLAIACNTGKGHYVPAVGTGTSGIELYDFDPLTGTVSNAAVIDSPVHYYGLCFSPDNSKLYASAFWERKLFQFDVTSGNPAAIQASKTFILLNPSYTSNLDDYSLGDIKAGPNGKMYVGTNTSYNQPGFNAYHVIHFPNLPGLACGPVLNYVPLPQGCFTGIDLPPDVVVVDKPDTVTGNRFVVSCFRDSIELVADSGRNYQWATSNKRSIFVKQPGIYIVQYTGTDCAWHIDTFRVAMDTLLPIPVNTAYSCPGGSSGILKVQPIPGDTATYTYGWRDFNNNPLRLHASASGDSLAGLDTGRYYLQITTQLGCDTVLELVVHPLPQPVASFDVKETVCVDEQVTINNTSSAPLYTWFYNGDSATLKNPALRFDKAGIYKITQAVGNLEGCKDTLTKLVNVKEFEIFLSTASELVDLNAWITLQSSASEPYTVSSWEPLGLFAQQADFSQSIELDSTTRFTVVGLSTYGCIDSASIIVAVRPLVFLPSAFSPNGDGRNDRFRPLSAGNTIRVRYFYIYDRWGKMVWGSEGSAALAGWDGTYNGTPAELGTYFYTINLETPAGTTIWQKGDVTLVR